jgi:hypothetical protein
MNVLQGLTLPLKVKDGAIVDGKGKLVLNGIWNSLETPLNTTGRVAILDLACKLPNDSFTYDHADRILHELGY